MTAASGDTSNTMQSTQVEEAKPVTNVPHVGEAAGEATLGGQRKGKQKKNKKKNKNNRAASQSIADPAAEEGGQQTSPKDILGEDAKLVGPESIESVGSGPNPIVELKSKEEGPGEMKDKKGPEALPEKGEIPVHKSMVEHEETKPVNTETSTFDTAPLEQVDETQLSTEIPIQPTVSPLTTSSGSAPVTPGSPLATESHLDFSPAAIFPHAFQKEEPPKHVFHEPNPIPNPIHPHQPGRVAAEDLVHTVTAHHHPPHQQTPNPQPNRLPQDISIPPPPKPNSAPPLHVPGPGVTAGRIVMLANPPPPTGCFAPSRERRLTEYNIAHVHAGHTHLGHGIPGDNPYSAHNLYVSSTETHPTGYTQNPHATEWSGTALRRGPYDSGLGGRSDEGEDDEGEGGVLFGRRTPTGAAVSTTGYHRRGEDVGLVASLLNLWEKSFDWFQEWVQATRW